MTPRKASECVFRDSAHAVICHTLRHMNHQHMQSVLATFWIFGLVIVVAMTGYLRSMSDGLMLAAFALGPPAAMWLWWTDPAETVSLPIQTVHGNVTRAGRDS
jgi:hypothetical protein